MSVSPEVVCAAVAVAFLAFNAIQLRHRVEFSWMRLLMLGGGCLVGFLATDRLIKSIARDLLIFEGGVSAFAHGVIFVSALCLLALWLAVSSPRSTFGHLAVVILKVAVRCNR